MPTLPFKISKAEIEKLSYERYAYPQPMIQKRIFSVYLKMVFNYNNRLIGLITGIHYNIVAVWIKVYKQKGFDGLLTNNYGTNKSELEDHTENILDSFLQRPPMNTAEAMQRISEMTGISRSEQQVTAFIKRHGLHFIKCGHIPAKDEWILSVPKYQNPLSFAHIQSVPCQN
jgi:transposase